MLDEPVKAIVDSSNKKDEVKKKGKQGSIVDMFARQAKRRKSEEKENQSGASNGVTSSPVSKKAKIVEMKTENGAFKSTMKCKQCRQLLEEVELYPGDSQDAREEFIALTDESLSLFVGNDESGRPQHKITNFCVYDKSTHVCSFDAGLIEKNIELFFSGVIKPVYEEDMSLENGVYGTRLGPINEWWTTGFDGGEKALVGFSTAFCDYILVEPHPCYANCWNTVQEKIYMSKIVIEFLCDNEAAVYEDLLNYIQNTVPPEALELSRFTEDSLLRHAQFVCEQVESFDDARKEDDDRLMANPCMRDLIHLAGVTVGRRKGARKGIVREKKVVKASSTKATTTPLVASVMESFFSGTVDIVKSLKPRLSKCGVCENCQRPNCGVCTACKDMKVFGGSGRSKQACHERKCTNMVYADDIEQLDEEEEESDKEIKPVKKHKSSKILSPPKVSKKSLKWSGESIKTEDLNDYFEAVMVGDETITVGDCVSVVPDDVSRSLYIGKICSLWENNDNSKKMMHIDWYVRGNETVLGETADKGELFLGDDCEKTEVKFICSKVDVEYKAPHIDWHNQGGVTENDSKVYDGETTFFYQKWFEPELARFVDPPKEIPSHFCQSCARREEKVYNETPRLGNPTTQESGKMYFDSVTQNGITFKIEDSVYLPVDLYDFEAIVPADKKKPKKSRVIDEEKYPEAYRKSKHVKGSNENVPQPFKIGCISSIFKKGSDKKSEIYLEVIKLYRPGDTHKGAELGYYKDLNLLYYSNEKVRVKFSDIRGKCFVQCEFDIDTSLVEYMTSGPDRFYFNEMYDAKTESFDDPPPESRRLGKKTQKKMVKMTKQKIKAAEVKEEKIEAPKFGKLKTLDVFAGCGGLSEGFHQAGIAESRYAIELWEPAAQAYKLNNPGTTVFTEDCNVLLESVMQGKEKSRCGQTLPQKGDVELLCGGPPCQGFSGMNRFNSREYSKFKNSLVVSYLSYCDYYRPRFFLLENVRNFVSFKNCMVLKLALSALLKMGYQCTFGVLQAGHYGVAQTRRRAIILAAAPGEQLPLYPEPLHTFSLKSGSLTVQVDDLKYKNNITRIDGAPFRTITVRDTMSDLPRIKNGHNKVEIPYNCDNTSHFQRMISNGANQTIIRDHICKDMSPLVEARMQHIPLASGSDWRDLPNIQVKLSDGTMTKFLRYTSHDIKQGKSSNGDLRGVCSCAEGNACDPMDRQFNTLVPWCLPHTGNRHNHWAGLYGRLEWDGFFSTTVTNPEPMGKQGRVLHPEQNRVVSVRECARSQGFPDNYRFYGTVLDKHRQVGNAVPPPMAKAIGMEIKKCLQWKAAQPTKEEN